MFQPEVVAFIVALYVVCIFMLAVQYLGHAWKEPRWHRPHKPPSQWIDWGDDW